MEELQTKNREGNRGYGGTSGGVRNIVHKSVLKNEVLEYLNVNENKNYLDATVGEGGHSLSILENNGPKGKVLGIEINEKIYEGLLGKGFKRLILVNDSFINLEKIIEMERFKEISGILFDLGFSSWHLKESQKGFSFLRDEDLDMRYSQSSSLTAKKIVNEWPQEDLERIIREYGEERFSKRIARMIVEKRKRGTIEKTFDLSETIREAVPGRYLHKRIHFATRTFQALRIATNNELENLKSALPQTLRVLEKGGRIVIISFHSLEDRIAKNFFKEEGKKGKLAIITKKPITPKEAEIIKNRSSRSAKLRAAIKI